MISLEGSTCAPGSLGGLNLKTRTKRPRNNQSASHLPLVSVAVGNRAGLHLSLQYRVCPAIALIAALAGLGSAVTSAKEEEGDICTRCRLAANVARQAGHNNYDNLERE